MGEICTSAEVYVSYSVFGLLRSEGWLSTDGSGQTIGPVFMGQHLTRPMKMGRIDCLETSVLTLRNDLEDGRIRSVFCRNVVGNHWSDYMAISLVTTRWRQKDVISIPFVWSITYENTSSSVSVNKSTCFEQLKSWTGRHVLFNGRHCKGLRKMMRDCTVTKIELVQYSSPTRVAHKICTNLWAFSKFWALEWWHEAEDQKFFSHLSCVWTVDVLVCEEQEQALRIFDTYLRNIFAMATRRLGFVLSWHKIHRAYVHPY